MTEGQFQPGSNDQVLRNQLGITDPGELNDVELHLLQQLTHALLEEVEEDQVITVDDLCEWHRRWLGNVYTWAGQYRSVNMGKDDFHFAAAHRIGDLMQELDSDFLAVYTPCNQMSEDMLVKALARVHIEYILVHPFREGNGRLARLLASIMALQANYPMLDFSYMDNNRDAYILAIQAGLGHDGPMREIFRQVLHDTMKHVAG
jgi:cell filamentation protein